jgi:5-formyltetrahydrofolate cyclo-ligase
MKKIPPYKKVLLANRLHQNLMKVLQKKSFKSILFYYPLSIEGDVRKTLQIMRKSHKVYLPFMEGKSFKMVPFRLPLKKKQFGIFEAGNSQKDIKNVDVVVVPSVGIDGNFQRIGFGKGMYDRFFTRLQKKPLIIFIQPKLCMTSQTLCDHYDVACDVVVTPEKIVTRKRKL